MLELEAKCTELLCVTNPRTFRHPFCGRFAFATDHEENWTAGFEKLFIDVKSLIRQEIEFKMLLKQIKSIEPDSMSYHVLAQSDRVSA